MKKSTPNNWLKKYQFAGPVQLLPPVISSPAVQGAIKYAGDIGKGIWDFFGPGPETKKSGFDYAGYINKGKKYLSRPVFQGATLKPEHLADAAQRLYNETGYSFPINMALAQGQFETLYGKKIKSKNNYFNVGNTDDGATRNYNSPVEAAYDYMKLMYNDYLNKGKKSIYDLLRPNAFVNYAGNRYASAKGYETGLADQMKVIQRYTGEKKYGGWLSKYEGGGDISIPDLDTNKWLTKYKPGGNVDDKQIKCGKNQVNVNGKCLDINSEEYRKAYNEGIGRWVSYDETSKTWKQTNPDDPNAQWTSSSKLLPEVVFKSKINKNISEAKKQALKTIGSFEDFKKQKESNYPAWYKSSTLYNPDKDLIDQKAEYENLLNQKTYQNVLDKFPQKEGEERLAYMDRLNGTLGKNFVNLAKQSGLTEPFEPANTDLMKQWAWKGVQHLGAGVQLGNPFATTSDKMQIGIDAINRGNEPVKGLTAEEAKEVGILQPFESSDNLAFNYIFKPSINALESIRDSDGKNSRRYIGRNETDKVFTTIFNPLNYIGPGEILTAVKGIGKGAGYNTLRSGLVNSMESGLLSRMRGFKPVETPKTTIPLENVPEEIGGYTGPVSSMTSQEYMEYLKNNPPSNAVQRTFTSYDPPMDAASRMKSLLEYGEQKVLNKLDFVTNEQLVNDKIFQDEFNKHLKDFMNMGYDTQTAIDKATSKTMDVLKDHPDFNWDLGLKSTLERLGRGPNTYNPFHRDFREEFLLSQKPLGSQMKMTLRNPLGMLDENFDIGNKSIKVFGDKLSGFNEANSSIKNSIKHYEDLLKIANDPKVITSIQNRLQELYQKILKTFEEKPFTGIDAFNQLRPNKFGGIIKDNRGQWAHPGKNTRISSSHITMQGVPYPVLGRANNGGTQMMYPGKDYHFPGADFVDEYPMMKYGGWLDKYQTGGETDEDYSAMSGFYNDLYEAGNKYANKNTGVVSPFNATRAVLKATLKHPEVLFMKRHSLKDPNSNPYRVESYITKDFSNKTHSWMPTDWAKPRRQKQNKVNIDREERKADRQIRRGIKKQGECWGANCNESLEEVKYGGWLTKYK